MRITDPVQRILPSHFPRSLAAFGFVLGLSSAALLAQTGAWADDTAAAGIGGRVFSFATWQGETYAGGHVFAAKGGEIACVARWDGTAWRAVGTGVALMGPWFPFSVARVRAMVEFQGQLVVAGTFDTAGGAAANNIARWNGSSWQSLGSGLQISGGDTEVYALAVYGNQLYAAGSFDTAGGLGCNGIARWNGTTWSPCGSGLGGFSAGIVGSGRSLLAFGTDLIVGGDFYSAGGVAANCIARWNGTAFSAIGPGFDGTVESLASFGGRIVAGGTFSSSGLVPIGSAAVWTGTGWQSLGSGGPNSQVTSLQVMGSNLYAGGSFVSPAPFVARFDGTSWSSFGTVAGVFSGTIGTMVLALGSRGTDLLVGGEFTRGGNPPAGPTAVVSTNVIAFDGVAWRGMGTGRGLDAAAAGILPWGGDWLAYGYFTQLGEVAASGLARFDGDRWLRFSDCNGPVQSAAIWNGSLVVSGTFTSIGGQPIASMARFDGTTWTSFGPPITVPLVVHQAQLYAGGTSDLRRWNGSSWASVALVSGIIDDLHVHSDGNLYFTTQTFSQHRVYRWNGSVATQIGTFDDFTLCLGSYGADLVVGGRFSTANGVVATRLARWNGTAWSALGGGVTGYAVESLCELDGRLYIGANGDPRGFFLRFDGTTWQAIPGNLSGVPITLFPDPAVSSVHCFASANSVAGFPVWNYAEWRNQPPWRNRLHGLPGATLPVLRGTGTLLPNTPVQYTILATPNHTGLLGLGLTRIDAPLVGGTLVPSPDVILPLTGNPQGLSTFSFPFPPNVPSNLPIFAQAFLLDPSAPQGWSASNALECLTP